MLHSLAHPRSGNEASTVMPGWLSLAPHQHARLLRHHRQHLQQTNRCSVASSTTELGVCGLQHGLCPTPDGSRDADRDAINAQSSVEQPAHSSTSIHAANRWLNAQGDAPSSPELQTVACSSRCALAKAESCQATGRSWYVFVMGRAYVSRRACS